VNIALERVFEGIVRVLRVDVIPNVDDPFARGQAVGVIDLINNIAPRVEWARTPLIEAVREKQHLLRAVAKTLGGAVPQDLADLAELSAPELYAEKARLDGEICEAMRRSHERGKEPAARDALELLIRHAHDEAAAEMKLTRKPLFGEIARGRNEKAAQPAG
jgi:uncharacterized protein YcaQ